MRKFLTMTVLLIIHSSVSAQITCPQVPVKLACINGIWHTQQVPLSDGFKVTWNDVEGKSCKTSADTFVFQDANEAYKGWGVQCAYRLANDDKKIYVSSRQLQHTGDNWSFDYWYGWKCYWDTNNCLLKPL